ncbi:MAG: immune inhibitor A [Oligoflexales bacterium]|nr:immune inhibitor A [Oligoflexales bacterium]
MNKIEVPSDKKVILDFRTFYDLEEKYDHGYVELSTDEGATWVQIDDLTGSSVSKWLTYDLTEKLTSAKTFMLRFRLWTDSTVQKDGWKLDDIALMVE